MDSLIVDVAAVADAVEAATDNTMSIDADNIADVHNEKKERSENPPPPLLRGWITKECRSTPDYYYYYNMDTGVSTWDPPTIANAEQVADRLLGAVGGVVDTESSRKEIDYKDDKDNDDNGRASKRQRTSPDDNDNTNNNAVDTDSSSSPTSDPTEVRVLHILKKHIGSRRPSSWRNPNITSTKEEAHEELEGLLEILREEESDLKELRATFEELARTESDCSSAKRGGDLGYFGRKKMQPEFEKEAFGLDVGEMTTNIVDTKSGSHILLRV